MPINGARVPILPTDPGSPAVSFVPSLQARALGFHRANLGSGCDCVEAGRYPCEDCRTEIAALVELLDTLAKDAIRLTSNAWERWR